MNKMIKPLGRQRFYWTLSSSSINQIKNNYKQNRKSVCKTNRNLEIFTKICVEYIKFAELSKIYNLNTSTIKDIIYNVYIKSSNTLSTDIDYYNRDVFKYYKRRGSAEYVKKPKTYCVSS